MTPLVIAVINGHSAIVKRLLRKNPTTSYKDATGKSLTAIAREKGYTKIERYLRKYGRNLKAAKSGTNQLEPGKHLSASVFFLVFVVFLNICARSSKDRAPDFESVGCRFESYRAHHTRP